MVELAEGADEGAVGAAITEGLCGHWEHPGPCRWPHHTAVDSGAQPETTIRTVFVASVADEPDIRARIRAALARGALTAPEGTGSWRLVSDRPTELTSEEVALATRIRRDVRTAAD